MLLWWWEAVVGLLGGYGLSPRACTVGALATLICMVGTWWVLVEERGVQGVYKRYSIHRVIIWCQRYISRHHTLTEEARRVSHLGYEGGGGGGSPGDNPQQQQEQVGKGKPASYANKGMREVSMRRILAEAARQIRPKFVFPATLFSIMVCLVNFLEPVMIGRFWDAIENVKQTGDYRSAANLLGIRALCILIRYVLHVIVGMIFSNAKGDMTSRMRREVFSRLLSQDAKFYDNCKPTELLDRLKRDPETLEELVNHTLERFFQAVVDLFCGLYLVRSYPWYLWGGALVLKAVPVTAITVRAGKITSVHAVVQRFCLQQADAVACESLANITTVRAHVGEEAEEVRHHGKTKQYLEVLMHTLYTDALLRYLRVFVRQTMELAFVVLGAYGMIYEKDLTMGKFMAFRSILDMLLRGLFTFADLYTSLSKLKRTSVRYFDLLDGKPEIESVRTWSGKASKPQLVPPKPVAVTHEFEGRLTIESVAFAYPSRPKVQVLQDVSLDVKPGQMLALCGASGVGKSTILKLLLRLYDPEMGRILIDGRDIRHLDTRLYRSSIGYVNQEPVLFDCSIAENIAYGLKLSKSKGMSNGVGGMSHHNHNDPGELVDGAGDQQETRVVTMADVKRAAMLACAHEFIDALPLDYETQVGSGGLLLSGGQRQRIAIARALIRQPKILLIDEPTSHMDPEGERAMRTALDNLVPGRTVCMIAHRMALIRNAHKIAVVNEGKIVQLGSHDDLMHDTEGKYYNLVQAEMLKAETPTP